MRFPHKKSMFSNICKKRGFSRLGKIFKGGRTLSGQGRIYSHPGHFLRGGAPRPPPLCPAIAMNISLIKGMKFHKKLIHIFKSNEQWSNVKTTVLCSINLFRHEEMWQMLMISPINIFLVWQTVMILQLNIFLRGHSVLLTFHLLLKKWRAIWNSAWIKGSSCVKWN